MKCSTAALSIATLSLAMLTPAFGQAPSQNPDNGHIRGAREAQHMVPARASLIKTLNSSDERPGYQFRATLRDTVHLDDGVELHKGDTLLGRVANDDMNVPGRSRLAIRFTRALLKNGQTIPIKATIVAVYSPGALDSSSGYTIPTQIPNSWNDGTLRVDQINALHDVDLHSRIASRNSAVFVSTRDNDVKIPAGSEIALAIAARNNTAPNNPANSGS